jgi:hypothetical protein
MMPDRFGTVLLLLLILSSLTAFSHSLENKLFVLNPVSGLEHKQNGLPLLEYFIGCALAEDQTIQVPTTEGKLKSFTGSLNLANGWLHRSLTEEERRWISACMLSRTNYFGHTVSISLRAIHPGLSKNYSADEIEEYSINEGAFYGNIMSSQPVAYACRGKGPFFPENTSLKKRICTEENVDNPGANNHCGIIITGNCEDVCEQYNEHSMAFSKCEDVYGNTYDEVITVNLVREHQ